MKKSISFVLLALMAVSPLKAFASDSCDEATAQTDGSDSRQLKAFKKLYDKNSTKLDDYLHLWYPDNGDGLDLESPFFACEDQPLGMFINVGVVPAKCRPDTLYSWGSEKMSHLVGRFQDGQPWSGVLNTYQGGNFQGGIFTSISAVSTFGYGERLMRFKIKPTTSYNFKMFGAGAGEVGIRTDMYHDFAIYDSTIVESISMGTPEIYDEVVRDIMHFKADKRVSAYNVNSETGLARLYSELVDSHVQSEEHLIANLRELLREILQGEGTIHYNSGVCRSRSKTFSTTSPSYVDPVQSSN